jgi:hypothetical protein
VALFDLTGPAFGAILVVSSSTRLFTFIASAHAFETTSSLAVDDSALKASYAA